MPIDGPISVEVFRKFLCDRNKRIVFVKIFDSARFSQCVIKGE